MGEQDDYLTVVGFMIYYVHHLSPPPLPFDLPNLNRSNREVHDLSPIASRATTIDFANAPQDLLDPAKHERTINTQPRLLLAGYSYGSLITTLLPPIINSILPSFQTPKPGSAHEEVRLRAASLATQQNGLMSEHFAAFHAAHTHIRGRSLHSDDKPGNGKARKSSAGVRMGGDESLRRSSHDSYRSRSSFSHETQEIMRKSVDRVRSIGKARAVPKRLNTASSAASSHKSGRPGSASSIDSPTETATKPEETISKEVPRIGEGLQIAYLLVSPLQGAIGGLATMWSSHSWKTSSTTSKNEMKLAIDPTLAIFGDDDVFVSISKLRAWSQKLAETGNSQFEYVEVKGAGHFWHGHKQLKILQDEISSFVRRL